MATRQLARLGQLDPKKTLFLLCDIQEKFRPGIPMFEKMVKNSQKLVLASKHFQIPLIVSEQFPEKLGPVVPELDVSHAALKYAKTQFSMATPELRNAIQKLFPDSSLESVVIFGLETHICVEQTAIDLRLAGVEVQVAADCALSRTQEDRKCAIERLRGIGCHITTSESILFKLMKDKNCPQFNELRRLVTHPSEDTGLSKL